MSLSSTPRQKRCIFASTLRTLGLLLATAVITGATGHADTPGFSGMHPALFSSERVHLSHYLVATLDDLGDDRVVTAGLGVKTANLSSFVLRSYEADTGTVISQDEFDLSVDPETAEAVAAGGGRVYAIGSGLTTEGTFSLLVRAYDARTGELLWIDELNPAANPRYRTKSMTGKLSRPQLIRISDRRQSHSLFTVRATEKESGRVLWQDEFLPSDEQVDDRQATGSNAHDQPGPRDFSLVVRTYEDPTNELLWEDRFDPVSAQERTGENEADLAPARPFEPRKARQTVMRVAP